MEKIKLNAEINRNNLSQQRSEIKCVVIRFQHTFTATNFSRSYSYMNTFSPFATWPYNSFKSRRTLCVRAAFYLFRPRDLNNIEKTAYLTHVEFTKHACRRYSTAMHANNGAVPGIPASEIDAFGITRYKYMHNNSELIILGTILFFPLPHSARFIIYFLCRQAFSYSK